MLGSKLHYEIMHCPDMGESQDIQDVFKVSMRFPFVLQRVVLTPRWQKTLRFVFRAFDFLPVPFPAVPFVTIIYPLRELQSQGSTGEYLRTSSREKGMRTKGVSSSFLFLLFIPCRLRFV